MAIVRVYVAARGTPAYNPEKVKVEPSVMGHMWYGIVACTPSGEVGQIGRVLLG